MAIEATSPGAEGVHHVGTATFTSTATSVEFNVGGLSTVDFISVTPIGASTDAAFGVADKTITSGAITVTRTTGTDSGLEVFVHCIGS